ncbi:hypothetical protein Tco_0542325 [Tanacetum coccineum]
MYKEGPYERGVLSQKESKVGRGVKKKQVSMRDKSFEVSKHVNVVSGSNFATRTPNDTMNENSTVGSAVKKGVTPSVVDMTVEKEKLSSLDDTTVMGSFPPLSTLGITTTGNAPGKSSYANITCKPSGKKVIVHTLFTPGGNGIDVVVPVDSIRAISERLLI